MKTLALILLPLSLASQDLRPYAVATLNSMLYHYEGTATIESQPGYMIGVVFLDDISFNVAAGSNGLSNYVEAGIVGGISRNLVAMFNISISDPYNGYTVFGGNMGVIGSLAPKRRLSALIMGRLGVDTRSQFIAFGLGLRLKLSK